ARAAVEKSATSVRRSHAGGSPPHSTAAKSPNATAPRESPHAATKDFRSFMEIVPKCQFTRHEATASGRGPKELRAIRRTSSENRADFGIRDVSGGEAVAKRRR